MAHRLSTVRHANRIVEAGTDAELMRLRGEYYRLKTLQVQRESMFQ